MKYSEWTVKDLGDNSCVFSISNYNENELFDYLYTIQQYILQLGLEDYSVLSFADIEYYDTEDKDLDIITDFPFSFFSVLNPDYEGCIKIKIQKITE